jgi:hypothetical protein
MYLFEQKVVSRLYLFQDHSDLLVADDELKWLRVLAAMIILPSSIKKSKIKKKAFAFRHGENLLLDWAASH